MPLAPCCTCKCDCVCVCLGPIIAGIQLMSVPRTCNALVACNVSAFKAPPKLFSRGKTLDVLMLFTCPAYNAVNGSDNAFKRCPTLHLLPSGNRQRVASAKWHVASGKWQWVNRYE